MGNQIALAVPNVKPSLIGVFLSANNGGNGEIRLVIPTDLIVFVLPFTVLLFVQNAKKFVAQSKAKLGITVTERLIIKSGMLGEANRKPDAVWLFLGGYFRFLALGHDDFQMVVGRVFL